MILEVHILYVVKLLIMCEKALFLSKWLDNKISFHENVNNGIWVHQTICILIMTQAVFPWTAGPWRGRHYDPSKHQKLYTLTQHNIPEDSNLY